MHSMRKKRENENRRKHAYGKTSDLGCSFFSSVLYKCVGFSNGQPRIHQGNQIDGFGCLAFEIGTTWIFFFNFEHCKGSVLLPCIIFGFC